MIALTPDLIAHIAAVRDKPGEPDDADLLVLADHLREAGDEDRADLIQVQVERGWCDNCGILPYNVTPAFDCGHDHLRDRERELTTRNPAWLSVPCPQCKGNGLATISWPCAHCDGTGDLLRERTTLTRGFVTVTLPSALCWRECQRCGGDGMAHGADRPFEWNDSADYRKCVVCRGEKVAPHPVLRAILASPVGIWVEAVRVSDREPWDFGGSHNQRGWWSDSGSQVHNRGTIPNDVYQHVQHEFILFGAKAYTTPEAAVDALARAVPLWARPLLGK